MWSCAQLPSRTWHYRVAKDHNRKRTGYLGLDTNIACLCRKQHARGLTFSVPATSADDVLDSWSPGILSSQRNRIHQPPRRTAWGPLHVHFQRIHGSDPTDGDHRPAVLSCSWYFSEQHRACPAPWISIGAFVGLSLMVHAPVVDALLLVHHPLCGFELPHLHQKEPSTYRWGQLAHLGTR